MKVVFLKNLKTLRKIKKHTQRSLAALVESTGPNISWLENLQQGAEPPTIRKLAAALDVTPEELIGDGGHYDKLHGKPEAIRPKATIGRPSPWSAITEKDLKTRVPAHVADAWRHFDFKKQVDKLALDFFKSLEN